MNIQTAPYLQQKEMWPAEGRHIMAHYDDTSIVVYQAFRPAIGRFAAGHGFFGGQFSFTRMTWIKPNFLWMMYRSGWGTKKDQEVTLAVHIRRQFFETILEQVVPSTFVPEFYREQAEWKTALGSSGVRSQWDPDHSPTGHPVPRRAIQLGLRRDVLAEYARNAILEIEDISSFVEAQRPHASPENYERLLIPTERVYIPLRPEAVSKLNLSPFVR